MLVRTLAAAVLLPVFILIIYFAPLWTAAAALCLLCILAAHEFVCATGLVKSRAAAGIAMAAAAGIPEEALFPYGRYVAKVDPLKIKGEQKAKLILVTAINPTPAGEGKTTVSVGLADGMTKIGKKAMLALREPALHRRPACHHCCQQSAGGHGG